MDKETSENVTIVVKSPYQIFSDQTICCSTDWTVERLKEEITQLCPSHPSVKEQKLIYWGKLLEDKTQLKDTLKIYEEGQSNHTVHLVLKNDQTYVKAEGLRKRNPASSSSTSPHPSTIPSPSPPTLPSPPDPRFFPFFNPAYMNAYGTMNTGHPMQYNPTPAGSDGTGQIPYTQEHMVQMQQAYVQYMQQYMQMMMGGAMPQVPPSFMQATPPRPAQVHVPDPNDNHAENQGEDRPRDWLDWFYLSSRALIFLTIVCFYSSPFRFMLVLVIGFAIYLYQSGFFRYSGPAILIGDNPAAGPAHRPAGPQPRPSASGAPTGPPADGENAATNPGNNEDGTSHPENLEENTVPSAGSNSEGRTPSAIPARDEGHSQSTQTMEGERPTVLGLTWSIVANFFASLLPEQPSII
ncbi:hypothetical protein M8J76_014698 [Diaphorina citri]|nr:hypothetical protein M8J76_014698 [Diaphorina citri]